MSRNLLIWKWSSDYDTPSKRRTRRTKFKDVTHQFLETSDSPAFGTFDQDLFLKKVAELFPDSDEELPFVIERYDKAISFCIPETQSLELIPLLGNLAMKYSLNGAEC